MMDLRALEQAFSDLLDCVATEPRLAEFEPVAGELREQARLVASGARALPALRSPCPSSFPSRELAARVVELLSRIPQVDADDDPSLVRAVGELNGNLVRGMVHAIFASYPDVVPREAAPGDLLP